MCSGRIADRGFGRMALAMAYYEVHLLRGDRWVIDAVFRNRDEALDLGRGIAGRGEVEGVRVVKECASTLNETASAMTLFESVRPRPKPAPRRRVAPPVEAERLPATAPAAERPLQVRPRPPAALPPWWCSPAGLSGLGAGLCVVLVTALTLLL